MPAEKRLKSKTLYRGKVINLRIDTVELPDGSRTEREIVEHSEVVHILAVDTDDRVLLVRQYRTPAGRELLETPAGGIRPGESPEEAAQRELREETGFRAGALELVYSFYSTPGFCTEFNHLFFATDLTYDPLEGDDDEDITVVPVSRDQVLQMIQAQEIGDAKSVAGLLLYLMRTKGEAK
ncbi:MAG: NUDIX hydrolase [Chloroflexi bacterium]|nr:NUDIX hydrolase [Chloroflexota bacterium]